ncbi:MAG: iron-sulfur cluster insertion protein ErpA [Chloroflexi bacterium]|nr:iron-sulfur cluster insertion protein ErpA [Chloroflexota bacterium]
MDFIQGGRQEMLIEQVQSVTLTPTAADRLGKLLREKELTNHGLRVFVSGGGCSGMQYGMAFEDSAEEGDEVFDSAGVRVFIDPTSLYYLTGVTIDYVDNLMGGGFKIDNPNAVSSCGCGHSFRTAANAAADEAEGGSCGCH